MGGEIWKIVPSAPWFLASSEGRIMVTPHCVARQGGGTMQYGGVPRFGAWNKRDARFTITHKGKVYKVHRLICEAFKGGAPKDKPVCMHVDENSANNRPDNLEWGSQKQNLNAVGFINYCRNRIGPNSPRTKWAERRDASKAAF